MFLDKNAVSCQYLRTIPGVGIAQMMASFVRPYHGGLACAESSHFVANPSIAE